MFRTSQAMYGRKFDPSSDAFGDYKTDLVVGGSGGNSGNNGSSSSSTLPTLYAINQVQSSPIFSRQPQRRDHRANSSPSPYNYEPSTTTVAARQRLEHQRKSLENGRELGRPKVHPPPPPLPPQLPPPNERAFAMIGSPIVRQPLPNNNQNHQISLSQQLNQSNHSPPLGSPFTLSDSSIIDGNEETRTDKVKTQLMSLWNNVKYGWNVKLKTSFSHETPLWMLGVLYHRNLLDSNSSHGQG